MSNPDLYLFTREERDFIGASNEVFEGEYAQEELRNLHAPHILDIGANVGAFAIWASRYFVNEPRIECWEPNLRLLPWRTHNFERFKPNVTRDHCCAVGESDDPITLFDLGRDHPGYSSVFGGDGVRAACTEVACIDAAKLPPCDILKVDCEGAECHVLTRYRHWDRVSALLLEWHTIPNRVLAEYVMRDVGFRCLRGFGDPGIRPGFNLRYGVQVWVTKS